MGLSPLAVQTGIRTQSSDMIAGTTSNMSKKTGAESSDRADGIAAEIRRELRGILRLWNDLRAPLQRFEPLKPAPPEGPRLYVAFDLRPRRRITGVRLDRLRNLSLPDERIQGVVWEFAERVWHLKDRLHQWVKATGGNADVEAFAKASQNLLICADLANKKKHGGNENRSNLTPDVGNVNFDTSKSGPIEFFYSGAGKDKELLVANPAPIPFTVELLIHDGTASLGDAVEIIHQAFVVWLPLIQKLGILSGDDNETKLLREQLLTS